MRAISVKQPWAWALFHGKDIENRSWATKYRGDLLIHASMKFDSDGLKWVEKHFPDLIPEFAEFRQGVLIGKVAMVDCVVHSSSPWFCGPYGHVYTNPTEFKKPMPFKGALKFFDVPDELIFA